MNALWRGLMAGGGLGLLLLTGCLTVDPGTLPDALVEATATACGCNCYLYGSYPHTWNGLLACYIAAIPYQGRITASTTLFAVLLFGAQQVYVWQANRKKHLHAFIG